MAENIYGITRLMTIHFTPKLLATSPHSPVTVCLAIRSLLQLRYVKNTLKLVKTLTGQLQKKANSSKTENQYNQPAQQKSDISGMISRW